MTKIGKLEIGGFYSVLIRANPPNLRFEMEDVFLQEACIGFIEGTFEKTAIICRIEEGSAVATSGGDVEMVEESKSPALQE